MNKLEEVQAPNSGALSAPHLIAFYCARVAPLASPLSLVLPFLSRSSSLVPWLVGLFSPLPPVPLSPDPPPAPLF